jgi:hypothetical protein
MGNITLTPPWTIDDPTKLQKAIINTESISISDGHITLIFGDSFYSTTISGEYKSHITSRQLESYFGNGLCEVFLYPYKKTIESSKIQRRDGTTLHEYLLSLEYNEV